MQARRTNCTSSTRCSAIAAAASASPIPEITEMQARAIFEAAADVQKKGIKVKPEVMIPLVGFKKELDLQVEIVHRVAKEVQAEKKVKISYLVGTMIEVPRGAITADEIAHTAEFFSFGTNDLTQTTLGMSRDDSGSFLPHYQELEIVKNNPFATIDQTRRRPAHADRHRARPQDPPRHQARHLRRTRRRPRLGEVLPQARPELRQLLALPRAGRAPRRRPGRPGGRKGRQEIIREIFLFLPQPRALIRAGLFVSASTSLQPCSLSSRWQPSANTLLKWSAPQLTAPNWRPCPSAWPA